MNSAGLVESADSASHQEHVLGTVRAEPVVDGRLIAQLQLLSRRAQDPRESFAVQAPQNCRSDETRVAGDIDSGIRVQRSHRAHLLIGYRHTEALASRHLMMPRQSDLDSTTERCQNCSWAAVQY